VRHAGSGPPALVPGDPVCAVEHKGPSRDDGIARDGQWIQLEAALEDRFHASRGESEQRCHQDDQEADATDRPGRAGVPELDVILPVMDHPQRQLGGPGRPGLERVSPTTAAKGIG